MPGWAWGPQWLLPILSTHMYMNFNVTLLSIVPPYAFNTSCALLSTHYAGGLRARHCLATTAFLVVHVRTTLCHGFKRNTPAQAASCQYEQASSQADLVSLHTQAMVCHGVRPSHGGAADLLPKFKQLNCDSKL